MHLRTRRGKRAFGVFTLLIMLAVAAPVPVGAEPGDTFELRGGVISFVTRSVSPDSESIVYVATSGLSVTASDGSSSRLLAGHGSPARVSTRFDFRTVQVSPDGQYVVFAGEIGNKLELYSVPFGGGSPTKLNAEFIGRGDLWDFSISPDSSRVVYLADAETNQRQELYSVPIGGGAVAKLNVELPDKGDVSKGFVISPDSNTVVYAADQDIKNQRELYSVPIGGGPITKLNDPLPEAGDVQRQFMVAPDGARVVYVADQDINDHREVWSVPIGGGQVTQLNDEFIAAGDVDKAPRASPLPEELSKRDGTAPVQISADSAWVVYAADARTNGRRELFSVPIGGGQVTRLTRKPAEDGKFFRFMITPDASRVVFYGEFDEENVRELYSTPIGDRDITKLNSDLPHHGDVKTVAISPDSSRVVYRADQDINNINEVYSVPSDGSAEPIKLSGQMQPNGDAKSVAITPDGRYVLYRADQTVDKLKALWGVPIDGGTIQELHGETTVIQGLLIAPDSSFVIIRDFDTGATSHLVIELPVA